MKPSSAVLRPGFALLAFAAVLSTGGASLGSDETTLVYPPFGHCLGLHRATAFHLFLYLGTRTQFDEPAGIAAVKLDALDDPDTTSDDDELTVFGLNSGACEIIYNTSLTSVELYGECGGGAGQFRNPLGIAADTRGNVFVADTGNNRVVRLLYANGRLTFVENLTSEGAGGDGLLHPSGIALGESGTLYVTDTGNDRVVVMTATGTRLAELHGGPGLSGGLEAPTGIAVVEADDPWISRKQEFIVVCDRGGSRLVKLSRGGDVIAAVAADELPVPAEFTAPAIDFYGSVYVTDRRNCRIHKFDSSLRYVTSVGRPGTGDMEFDEPRGITLWRRFGQIFVTERAGAQYFWIGTDVLRARAEPDRLIPGADELRLRYFLTEVARVTVELIDSSGRVVHTLVSNRRRATGDNVERWDGLLGRHGGPAAPGAYTLRVTARPTYSSGEYFQDTAEVPITLVGPPPPRRPDPASP